MNRGCQSGTADPQADQCLRPGAGPLGAAHPSLDAGAARIAASTLTLGAFLREGGTAGG